MQNSSLLEIGCHWSVIPCYNFCDNFWFPHTGSSCSSISICSLNTIQFLTSSPTKSFLHMTNIQCNIFILSYEHIFECTERQSWQSRYQSWSVMIQLHQFYAGTVQNAAIVPFYSVLVCYSFFTLRLLC